MNEELDIEAAEYVLGTLTAEERARFASRLAGDAGLREAMRQWRDRLAALDETAMPEAPPVEVWRAIERATRGERAASPAAEIVSNVVTLRRRLAVWRGAALGAGALAAGLAAIVVLDRLSVAREPEGGRYVAVVDTGGHEPALIAEVDTHTGIIRIRSLAAETPSGQSLELWHVAEGQAPRSLGLLEAGADAQTIQDAAIAAPAAGVIAVSVEPRGGSPSGAPTGEIVYSGQLVPME